MTRRRSNKSKTRGQRGQSNFQNGLDGDSFNSEASGLVTIPFRKVIATTVSASTAVFSLPLTIANLSTRLQNLSNNFQLWRLSKLRLTLSPNPQLTDFALGFSQIPDESVAPASFAAVLETMSVNTMNGAFQTTPSTLMVPPRVLRRKEQPWLRCDNITGDTLGEVAAGQIICYGRQSFSGTITVILDGVAQFSSPSVSGLADPQPEPDPLAGMVVSYASLPSPSEDEKEETASTHSSVLVSRIAGNVTAQKGGLKPPSRGVPTPLPRPAVSG
jgi:hypothetical protein